MDEIFQKYDIELSVEERKKFHDFLRIFKETNTHINLSAIRGDNEIIKKHFVDSIMLWAFFDITEEFWESAKVADLGTWGGFPGIPLAIITPDAEFTLIDSVAKKLKCIDDFAETLELDNIETLCWRAEDIGQNSEYREQFDLVVSRATAYFPTLIEYTLPLLKVWWVFAAYKLTDKEEFGSIKKALSRLWGKLLKVKNYEIDEQERSIVFIEKIAPTHKNYPRKVGIPLQKPII